MDLGKIEIPDNVKTVKKQIFNFGEVGEIKKVLPELFKMLDGSISEFNWFPYYDKISEWLSNDGGVGIALYAAGDEKNNGIGKSVFCTKVYPTILKNFIKPEKYCTILNCTDLNKSKLDEILKNEGQIVLVLDELGREPKIILDYGNEIRPMEMIFEKAERCGWKLIISTNMTEIQTHKHYASRHLSERLRSLCLPISCSGKSLRKSIN